MIQAIYKPPWANNPWRFSFVWDLLAPKYNFVALYTYKQCHSVLLYDVLFYTPASMSLYELILR